MKLIHAVFVYTITLLPILQGSATPIAPGGSGDINIVGRQDCPDGERYCQLIDACTLPRYCSPIYLPPTWPRGRSGYNSADPEGEA
ncbi:hypothetical protein CVT24_006943 [Panaeolus cyanescens]|uniref:CBM1 domain-containing protein n=1 Tax=Panaeolus cyanescens TaxID=181874 RepID=A0A409W049_9AGAR|nr:hypothetical protein CVT24_006943 [Panaeolus cyanescens]